MACYMNYFKSLCYSICTNWLFILLLLVAIVIGTFHLNMPLFIAINNLHSLLPDGVWMFINSLTYTKYGVLSTILFLLTLIFRREKILRVVLLIGVFYLLFMGLKIAFGEARPYITIPQGNFFWLNSDGVFWGLSLSENIVGSAYKSFPSGHVGQTAMFVFAIITLFFPKNILAKIILVILLLLVGFSRVCTGWHWPLDVIASMLISYVLVKIFLYNKNDGCNQE